MPCNVIIVYCFYSCIRVLSGHSASVYCRTARTPDRCSSSDRGRRAFHQLEDKLVVFRSLLEQRSGEHGHFTCCAKWWDVIRSLLEQRSGKHGDLTRWAKWWDVIRSLLEQRSGYTRLWQACKMRRNQHDAFERHAYMNREEYYWYMIRYEHRRGRTSRGMTLDCTGRDEQSSRTDGRSWGRS